MQFFGFLISIWTLCWAQPTANFAFWQKAPLVCPTGYIKVPKNLTYVSQDFCVMKYEAKARFTADGSYDADGTAVSTSTHHPDSVSANGGWRISTYATANNECLSLGTGYSLISNAQWQTIARNVELVAANWTSGTVGSGCLFQGNNGETTCGYNGANPLAASSTNARGQLTLSNGEIIHDFAGNLSEWTNESNGTNYGANAYLSTVTAATHTTTGTLSDGVARSAKAQFGPSGSYPTSNNNSGLGLGEFNSSAGALARGGDWDSAGDTGIFSTCLNYSTLCPSGNIGFRCVYVP